MNFVRESLRSRELSTARSFLDRFRFDLPILSVCYGGMTPRRYPNDCALSWETRSPLVCPDALNPSELPANRVIRVQRIARGSTMSRGLRTPARGYPTLTRSA